MILQALCQYYERLRADPDSGVAPPGYCAQGVTTSIVLKEDGTILQARDLRDVEGRKARARILSVPARPVGRTGQSIRAAFLVDETGYALGDDGKGKAERSAAKFEAFKELHQRLLCGVTDPAGGAFLRFLRSWQPSRAASLERWEEWRGLTVAFEYGNEGFLHERAPLRAVWEASRAVVDAPLGQCLVTGRNGPIARLHPAIKGVRNAQTTGAAIVSFNFDAACSYGRDQSFNAPVGEPCAFAYTTALNHLFRDLRHRVQVGDATTVFWTAKPTRAESFMGWVFESTDDAAETGHLREWLQAARSGRRADDPEIDVPFFVLGIAAPAKARLSVRFWMASTVGEMAERLSRHFGALAIERQRDYEAECPALHRLMLETALLHKPENIPETLSDAMARSVLTGERYPQSLLPTVLARIRAEQADHDKKTGKPIPSVNYFRAALIKAALIRNHNLEVSMSLNPDCREPGYLLGRLFAVLERTQENASPGINATIRDRYFGSASATPGSVFPILTRLNQHHLSKLKGEKPGLAVNMEKLTGAIKDAMSERYPIRLNLEQQGMFDLGYYHQRNDLFRKKIAGNEEEEPT